MAEENFTANYAMLEKHDEVKFVVSSRRDFDWAIDIIDHHQLPEKTANLIFSPVWGRVKFDDLAQWIIDSNRPVRMQLQLHKMIWGEKQGV
jgi:7-carboxy-7-deazaguanine synthase